jgi:thiol:disulfide interchange protein DsbC
MIVRTLLLGILAGSTALAGVCDGITDSVLRKHAPIPPYQVMSKREINGLCEMILNINGQFVPIYATKDFILAGEMFSGRKQITQEQIAKLKKEQFKKLKKEIDSFTATVYKPENAKGKVLYFITDPDCPYCNRFKKTVKEFADKNGITVKLVFFPLPFHKGADRKAESFICEGKTFEDYLKDSYGSKTCEEGQKKIRKMLILAREAGIRGTPTFITENGKVITGFRERELARALGIEHKVDVSKIDLSKAIQVGNGKGKKIVVVTDPTCPFCKRACNALRHYAEEGKATFYVCFLPVHGDASKRAIEFIFSQPKETRAEVLAKIFEGKLRIPANFKPTSEAEKLFKENLLEANKIGATATPTFILSDGKVIEGARIKEIEKAINGG